MNMKANNVLTKYEFLSRMKTNGLNKDLLVKIISMRIEYGKIKRQYDEDFKEFAQSLITPEFETLRDKQEKTDNENKKWNNMVADFNTSYNKYVTERIQEDVEVSDKHITAEDLEELIVANADNDVDINGNYFTAGDFLENISILFS